MAGIGFKLREMTASGTAQGYLRGYLSAGFITNGPWIMTVLTLAAIRALAQGENASVAAFEAVVVYVYAFSLITTGAVQNVVTRYLADRLFQGDAERHLPCLIAVLLVVLPVQALTALAATGSLAWGRGFWLLACMLYALVSGIWLLNIYLGAVRAYESVVGSFVGGTLTAALSMALLFSAGWGETGILAGFTLGHAVVFFLMLAVLVREFDLTRPADFAWVTYFARYPYLALAGLTMNLGVWSGVIFYWGSPFAVTVAGLATYPTHDTAVFLALLTVLPALTVFFVRIETEFYEGYRAFYGGITHGRVRHAELVRCKGMMQQTLLRGLADVVTIQGLVTLVVAFYPRQFFWFLHLSPDGLTPIRVAAVGAFLFVLVQFCVVALYYYEAYRQAFLTGLCLVVVNVTVDILTLANPQLHGLGLGVGSALALALGATCLRGVLHDLDFRTFTRQPMPGQAQAGAFGQSVRLEGRWLIPVDGP